MKKLLSILLCAALLFGTLSTAASANEDELSWDGDPIVFLQGFTGTPLVLDYGLETERPVWGGDREFDVNKILSSLPAILTGLVLCIFGNDELLISSFSDLASGLLGDIACGPDGAAVYNVTPYPYTAEESRFSTLIANDDEVFIPEVGITTVIRETVPEEYIFTCNVDWRKGQVENAERMAGFIDDVLEITGKEKVDIYALSHGGQTAATYLYYHGTEGKVDNAVLDAPAICGTTIVTGLLGSEPTNFDMHEIARFASVLLNQEIDLRFLGYILPGDFLNQLIKTAFNECFLPYAINFGSVWDFMDPVTYDKLKAEYLNPLVNYELIRKADMMHYDCMKNIGTGLRAAQQSGVNIYIISNCGTRMGTGEQIDSDFVIDTVSSSGAYVMPYGEHFADNYVQKNTVCTDPTHNHVSPSRTIDASAAYLPENTWFVQGQYHCQVMWDDYTNEMIFEMLLTDNIKDVHSDPRYPQFELAQNPFDGVYAAFTNEKSGYYNSESNEIVIRNLSEEYGIRIRSIKADGCEFDVDKSAVIAPGEEITVACTKLSDGDYFKMDISYSRNGEILSPAFTRTVYFSRAK